MTGAVIHCVNCRRSLSIRKDRNKIKTMVVNSESGKLFVRYLCDDCSQKPQVLSIQYQRMDDDLDFMDRNENA